MPKASDYRSHPRPPYSERLTVGAPGKLDPTPGDILGPYYRPGAPIQNILCDYPDLQISGRVLDRDGNPVPDAVMEFWQADPDGKYDNDGFKFRGRLVASGKGEYLLETTKPGCYDISEPTDPEPHEFRCSHVHVMIRATGFNRQKVSGPGIDGWIKAALLTQLYFKDSKFDDVDRWFDARRCVKPTDNPGRVTFDFVLERE